MDPAAAKQQIVDKVRQATNVLVTVSTNPTVDQLAACIGLTLLLNKMEKHATAVFSGQVPSTLEFLQPEKTLETNTDSLRDFIISLDKEKADKLRYKVEDQVVKIYITPYKTSLSEKDLVFSQGDFNVEIVFALGIKDRTQIDQAIASHGQILHDATVISLAAGEGKAADLGQINWQDAAASSLCEMLTSISEAFGGGLIDNQIATAFLTGIVAETNRFSSPKTSPKVMTMSAQLMAAGANQQLIISKLDQPVAPAAKPAQKLAEAQEMSAGGTLNVEHDTPETKSEATQEIIEGGKPEATPVTSAAPQVDKPESDEIHIDAQGNLQTAGLIKPLNAEPKKDEAGAEAKNGPKSPLDAVLSGSDAESAKPAAPETEPKDMPGQHTLLNPSIKQPVMDTPFTANTQPEWQNPYDSVSLDPLGGAGGSQVLQHKKVVQPLSDETAAKAGADGSVDQARNAVESALAAASFDPGSAAAHTADAVEAAAPAAQEPMPVVKPLTPGDTPSLPLPGAQTAPPPIAPPNTTPSAAPPPIPPPIVAAPGAVIPTPPSNQK